MKSAILTSDSNKNLEILLELAKQLGIQVSMLTEEQIEDFGLVQAIKEGRTGNFIDTDEFVSSLK